MNKYAEYVRSQLDDRTLLEQLAEEASELSKASLKLIRAKKLSNNYTPITNIEAERNLIEEITDVINTMAVLFGRNDF